MKKIAVVFVFCIAICGFAFVRSSLRAFEKAKEIRLLESTLNDVQRILVNFESDGFDEIDNEQTFSTENAEIEVSFSSGDCSEDSQYWNVRKLTATKVKISFENPLKVEDFKFDFSNFKKEIRNENYPEAYIYQNENLGIIVDIDDNEIQKIILFPARIYYSSLCKNERTEEIFSKEKRLVDFILEDEITCRYVNPPANVEEVKLSKNEIIIGCKNKGCGDSAKISVTTIAHDPDNDVLTYVYEVSAGRIVGMGANVTWDLTGVEAGIYTITVFADDGSGEGNKKTETVVVRECPDCQPKK